MPDQSGTSVIEDISESRNIPAEKLNQLADNLDREYCFQSS